VRLVQSMCARLPVHRVVPTRRDIEFRNDAEKAER
jgi:hypothetical protein